MAEDRLKIAILDDGTIRVEADAVSAPNHASAEAFLSFLASLAGGPQTRARKAGTHHHHHHHGHEHEPILGGGQ